jgi:hypothetical protein
MVRLDVLCHLSVPEFVVFEQGVRKNETSGYRSVGYAAGAWIGSV